MNVGDALFGVWIGVMGTGIATFLITVIGVAIHDTFDKMNRRIDALEKRLNSGPPPPEEESDPGR
jgi:3-hydroxyacyl-CoA dehydrogenase